MLNLHHISDNNGKTFRNIWGSLKIRDPWPVLQRYCRLNITNKNLNIYFFKCNFFLIKNSFKNVKKKFGVANLFTYKQEFFFFLTQKLNIQLLTFTFHETGKKKTRNLCLKLILYQTLKFQVFGKIIDESLIVQLSPVPNWVSKKFSKSLQNRPKV